MLTLALATGIAAPALAEGWEHYENARFRFVIDVPEGFVAKPAPDNGDGQKWTTPDGYAELIAFGSLGTTFNAEKAAAKADPAGRYFASGKSWFVTSGIRDRTIFYARTIRGCDGAVITFRFEYPALRKISYDGLIKRIGKSLKSLPCS
ncbi:hypothetical protein [Gellertiella hungarica]